GRRSSRVVCECPQRNTRWQSVACHLPCKRLGPRPKIAYDGTAMARRLTVAMCLATLLHAGSDAPAAESAIRARAIKVQTSIRGATQMFAAPWGLVAQGSGQLRILP